MGISHEQSAGTCFQELSLDTKILLVRDKLYAKTMAYDNPDNLSPWALRFGPLKLSWAIDANGVRHSGLGATHPDLDARYYHDVDGIDIPLKNPHVPRPSDTELDALFHRERSQQWILAGPKTRQLGALSAWTFLAESGHTLYHEDNLGGVPFNIDESTWFDFMQRNRWYKPEVEPTDTVPSPHLEPVSVENEIVWDHMRWSMQLVQRILWLMTEEQHYLWVHFWRPEMEEGREGFCGAVEDRLTTSQFRCSPLWRRHRRGDRSNTLSTSTHKVAKSRRKRTKARRWEKVVRHAPAARPATDSRSLQKDDTRYVP